MNGSWLWRLELQKSLLMNNFPHCLPYNNGVSTSRDFNAFIFSECAAPGMPFCRIWKYLFLSIGFFFIPGMIFIRQELQEQKFGAVSQLLPCSLLGEFNSCKTGGGKEFVTIL